MDRRFRGSGVSYAPERSALRGSVAHGYPSKVPIPELLASYWRFLVVGLNNGFQTGAVLPSQRFLVQRMLEPVPPGYCGDILELGAGTGALTLRLAARCPSARIVACEINPLLSQETVSRLEAAGFGQVRVVCDSAQHVLAEIRRRGQIHPGFILSGIPLGNLPRRPALALIDSIHRTLAPGGTYVQFQYSLLDRKKIRARFSRLRTTPVLLNLPPAFVYRAVK